MLLIRSSSVVKNLSKQQSVMNAWSRSALSFGAHKSRSFYFAERTLTSTVASSALYHTKDASMSSMLDDSAGHLSNSSADSRHFLLDQISPCNLEQNSSDYNLINEAAHTLPHPIWSNEALKNVRVSHRRPEKLIDKLAFGCVKTMRFGFDVLSGYALGRIDERGWLNRIVFLETVAGVPGMVGAMVRHLNSLRRMNRDYGWIHTLLEEAENERMHLMTALVLRKPSYLFRLGVLLTQGFFLSGFALCYILSHRFAHRFVAYLEEEAVVTYTKLLDEIDHGHLPLFKSLPAPTIAREYWLLAENASFRDVILAIRADEDHHRLVNHTFAELNQSGYNPFLPGQ